MLLYNYYDSFVNFDIAHPKYKIISSRTYRNWEIFKLDQKNTRHFYTFLEPINIVIYFLFFFS